MFHRRSLFGWLLFFVPSFFVLWGAPSLFGGFLPSVWSDVPSCLVGRGDVPSVFSRCLVSPFSCELPQIWKKTNVTDLWGCHGRVQSNGRSRPRSVRKLKVPHRCGDCGGCVGCAGASLVVGFGGWFLGLLGWLSVCVDWLVCCCLFVVFGFRWLLLLAGVGRVDEWWSKCDLSLSDHAWIHQFYCFFSNAATICLIVSERDCFFCECVAALKQKEAWGIGEQVEHRFMSVLLCEPSQFWSVVDFREGRRREDALCSVFVSPPFWGGVFLFLVVCASFPPMFCCVFPLPCLVQWLSGWSPKIENTSILVDFWEGQGLVKSNGRKLRSERPESASCSHRKCRNMAPKECFCVALCCVGVCAMLSCWLLFIKTHTFIHVSSAACAYMVAERLGCWTPRRNVIRGLEPDSVSGSSVAVAPRLCALWYSLRSRRWRRTRWLCRPCPTCTKPWAKTPCYGSFPRRRNRENDSLALSVKFWSRPWLAVVERQVMEGMEAFNTRLPTHGRAGSSQLARRSKCSGGGRGPQKHEFWWKFVARDSIVDVHQCQGPKHFFVSEKRNKRKKTSKQKKRTNRKKEKKKRKKKWTKSFFYGKTIFFKKTKSSKSSKN